MRLRCADTVPTNAPISSCATVPTTISDSAVAIRNRIEISVAASASPSQSAARSQTSVMADLAPSDSPPNSSGNS
jgi:hypothetical protein